MFVLLEHAAPAGVHWDFMIELPGRERLMTWRLAADPRAATAGTALEAERIFDHPRRFLDYEGPLRGGKGSVRRLDRGAARVRRCDDAEVLAELEGERLRGVVRVVSAGSGWRWTLDPA